jgi:hypothetical protein
MSKIYIEKRDDVYVWHHIYDICDCNAMWCPGGDRCKHPYTMHIEKIINIDEHSAEVQRELLETGKHIIL